MFARIPALLSEGMTKNEIAAMFGVTPRHFGGAVQ
jgi:predicted transcriptional regulator